MVLFNTKDIAGHYGTIGVADAANVPPMTEKAISWTDTLGNLWMFGGYSSSDPSGQGGLMNSLWKFTLESGAKYGMWSWMGGGNLSQSPGVYGTKGIADAANVPGARVYSHTWTDAGGNLWLMDGGGFGKNLIYGVLNDLWCYNISSKKWTWVSGDDVANPAGIYGTKGIPNVANKPCAAHPIGYQPKVPLTLSKNYSSANKAYSCHNV